MGNHGQEAITTFPWCLFGSPAHLHLPNRLFLSPGAARISPTESDSASVHGMSWQHTPALARSIQKISALLDVFLLGRKSRTD